MLKEMTSKVMSRRSLLAGAAMLGAGVALAGCSTAQVASFETAWATVAGTIQQAVATASAYIPTIESIAETAAGLFGPAYASLVTIGSAAFNQIIAALTNVVNNLSPPASSRLNARLASSSASAPVYIGTTPSGVKVTGWSK